MDKSASLIQQMVSGRTGVTEVRESRLGCHQVDIPVPTGSWCYWVASKTAPTGQHTPTFDNCPAETDQSIVSAGRGPAGGALGRRQKAHSHTLGAG